jgi:hypothetical protein
MVSLKMNRTIWFLLLPCALYWAGYAGLRLTGWTGVLSNPYGRGRELSSEIHKMPYIGYQLDIIYAPALNAEASLRDLKW